MVGESFLSGKGSKLDPVGGKGGPEIAHGKAGGTPRHSSDSRSTLGLEATRIRSPASKGKGSPVSVLHTRPLKASNPVRWGRIATGMDCNGHGHQDTETQQVQGSRDQQQDSWRLHGQCRRQGVRAPEPGCVTKKIF